MSGSPLVPFGSITSKINKDIAKNKSRTSILVSGSQRTFLVRKGNKKGK